MAFDPDSHIPSFSTEKTVTTEYFDASGNPTLKTGYTTSIGPGPNSEMVRTNAYQSIELACGDYFPGEGVRVGGRCWVCSEEIRRKKRTGNPNVCTLHHVICPTCGLSLCWTHSRGSVRDPAVRLCCQCHRKEKSKQMIDDLKELLRSFLTGRH